MKGRPSVTANQVTLLRLALIPLACWLLYQGRAGELAALVFATLVGCTDFVDGYLARKHGPTVLGSLMDPIADKVFIAATFIPAMDVLRIPAWMVALLFVREFAVTAARTSYERRGLQLKSSYLSRYKTWVQMCGVGVLFMIDVFSQHTVTLLLFGGAALPVVLWGLRWLSTGNSWKGAAWFAVSFALLGGMHVYAGGHATAILLMYFIIGVTWASGLGYVLGVGQLRGRGGLSVGEVARLATAVGLPIVVVAARAHGMGPAWALIALLAVELAHGGLDNLLAHHHTEAGAGAWSLRMGSEILLLGAAMLLLENDDLLAASILAAAIALVGFGFAFVQKRELYLDPKPATRNGGQQLNVHSRQFS